MKTIKRQKEKFELKPKYHYVKSWKDIPGSTSPGVRAKIWVSDDGKKQEIYLVKNKISESDKLHEEAHARYGHSKENIGKDISLSKYIEDEINASLYSYDRIKKPKGMIMEFRGILNNINEDTGITYRRIYKTLCKNLTNVPITL